ncbi:membrane fusion protein (multidrug efflux system) [Neisseria sp. HSC-16F19]|nr:efflux RND transporter periplasmic adaptor subunit [Neisseria sp. HSC-16F19]MCP2039665.1 membrane fusion protein (multidrug efflux system) [Neisseria sp. HSC-16F19]
MNKPISSFRRRSAAVMVAAALALAACGGQDQAQQAPPEPVVSVLTVQPATVTVGTELSGRLKPIREAQVRARAAGIVQKRLFEEGSYVRAGQALFQIDNAPYVAQLQTARASVATAQAQLAKANADLARYRPLVEADAISKQEYDAAVAAQRLAQAQLQSAQAAVKTAQISVGYAHVTAPISGRIGKALVTEGALVGQGDATQLALIQQTDTLYVDLKQSAAAAMKIRQDIANGVMQQVDGAVPVTILLEDGTPYAQQGRLLFADMTVDEATGQVSLRAEVPNDGNVLLPGMFVTVSIPQAEVHNAFEIPQHAVTRGQTDTVMVVDASGSLQPKVVTVVGQKGNNWIVSSGLNAGDQVVMDGLSTAMMLQAKTVKTQPWQQGGQAAAASAPAAVPADAASSAAASAASAAE